MIYILFQTDIYKSKKSRVCFGVYSCELAAISAAKQNNLYRSDCEVEIVETVINKFNEI